MSNKLPKITDRRSVMKMLKQINTDCPTGIRNYAIIMMMYRAGLRVSEVCKLGLSDMHFETGLIYVQQGKGKKDRYIPMDEDIIKTCQKWLAIRPESEYFFCTLKSGMLDKRYIREVCSRISIKAGVYIQDGEKQKPVSPHKLRHTCFAEMLREGDVDIKKIQEIAGHSRLDTTVIYTHIIQDDLQEKIKKRKGVTE